MLGFFTLTTIIYAAKEGVHAPSFGDFKPTYALFIGLVPVLFFNYVGFELPSTAGDEMENPQRDVPFTVLRSAVASILLYGVPILAIIIVLPAAALSGLGGFIDAMKTVFTVYGGNVTTASDGTLSVTLSGAGTVLGDLMALMFIWALLSSGTTWIMGADRALAVAVVRRLRPAVPGHVLGTLRHAGERQPDVRHHVDRRDGAGPRAVQRRRRRSTSARCWGSPC